MFGWQLESIARVGRSLPGLGVSWTFPAFSLVRRRYLGCIIVGVVLFTCVLLLGVTHVNRKGKLLPDLSCSQGLGSRTVDEEA